MRRRPQLLVAALLAFGLLAAGCGDDDEDKKDDSPATTQSAPPAETTTTGDEAGDAQTTTTETESEQPAGDGDDPYAPGAEIRKRAAEACKQSVQAAQQLSEGVRSDLEEICEEAADGDEKDLRDASRRVCERIIEESVPAGSGREQALESCAQAGG